MGKKKEFIVSFEDKGSRLDTFLVNHFSGFSRARISHLIQQGHVLVNQEKKKPGYKLKGSEKIFVKLDFLTEKVEEDFFCDLEIVYEDESILVINKPYGLVVHSRVLHSRVDKETLVNALRSMGKKLSSLDPLRAGIVHRLDKETSGLIVVAKTNQAHERLVEQFKQRKVNKEYQALVWGVVDKESFVIEQPLMRNLKNRLTMKIGFLNSKAARTEGQVIKRYSKVTQLRLKPVTGRTHQLRVHMKFLGFPIVGDMKYGKKDKWDKLLLHAEKLSFYHPQTGKLMQFKSLIPNRFQEFLAHTS